MTIERYFTYLIMKSSLAHKEMAFSINKIWMKSMKMKSNVLQHCRNWQMLWKTLSRNILMYIAAKSWKESYWCMITLILLQELVLVSFWFASCLSWALVYMFIGITKYLKIWNWFSNIPLFLYFPQQLHCFWAQILPVIHILKISEWA